MNKQNKIIVGVIALVLALTVGYALFTSNLTINGTAKAEGKFEVLFKAVGVLTEKGSSGATATISSDSKTLEINIPKLEYPGAYVEIPVTISNDGSIDAKLTGITLSEENDDISVSYSGIEQDGVLRQGNTSDIKIKVMWKEESTVSLTTLNFNIGLDYVQITADDINNITTSSSSLFPAVSGSLGDNILFSYNNGNIAVTGSGTMNDGLIEDDGYCSGIGSASYCTLGSEITAKVIDNLNIKNENVKSVIKMAMPAFIVGSSYETFGTTKDEFKNMLISNLELSDADANSVMQILESVPTLKSITIENGITSLRPYFLQQANISSIILPNTLTAIGKLFMDLAKIDTLTFEDGTTTILTNLMSGETGSSRYKVNKIIIPSSVTTIQEQALDDSINTIQNKTGKAFDWNGLLGGTSSSAFEAGTVQINGNTVTITN